VPNYPEFNYAAGGQGGFCPDAGPPGSWTLTLDSAVLVPDSGVPDSGAAYTPHGTLEATLVGGFYGGIKGSDASTSNQTVTLSLSF
jgi:hypothetical protein